MKCIPITRSGCSTAEAILVIEMDEVLVAKIVEGGTIDDSCVNKERLRSKFSVAASTMNELFETCYTTQKKNIHYDHKNIIPM